MTHQAIVGATVWTAGFAAPRPLDFLVTENRITQVARAGELELPEGFSDADVLDLSGKTVLPGFQDAHVHPGTGGMDLLGCPLGGLESASEIEAAIAAYASTLAPGEWLLGGGYSVRAVYGTAHRDTLDRLAPGRPVALQANTRHAYWVNTAVLEAAGITADTPNPVGGIIERDEQGIPTGVLHERAIDLILPVLPTPSSERMLEALLTAQEYLLPLGMTALQDALVGTGLGLPDYLETYAAALQHDQLVLRATTALWWDAQRGVEQIPELIARRAALEAVAGPDRIIADTVKMMVDGTAVIFLKRQALIDATTALDAAGFTVHFHSYGEQSTKNVLDAVEAARARRGSTGRHHIAHLMVIAPDDFHRFAQLNVTANIQGYWGNSPVAHQILKPSTITHDPHTREYAFARLEMAGARLAAGSDWPVTTPDPLAALAQATGRHRKTGAGPDELDRLDVASVLTAFTAGSAYVNGRADTTGRIAPGFLADFVVLSGSPFAGEQPSSDIVVEQTWIDGVCRYQRG